MAIDPNNDQDNNDDNKPRSDAMGMMIAALGGDTSSNDSVISAFNGIKLARGTGGKEIGSVSSGPNSSVLYTRPGASTPVNLTANIKTGMDYFQSQGWSKEAASGIVANGIVESGLNPSNVGDSGLAHGVFQWHPDRLNPLERAYASDARMGASPDDTALMKNFKMMNYELKYGAEKAHGALLAQQTSAADAGAVFSKLIERPLRTEHEMTVRAAKAEGVLAGVNRAEAIAGKSAPKDGPVASIAEPQHRGDMPRYTAQLNTTKGFAIDKIEDTPKPGSSKKDDLAAIGGPTPGGATPSLKDAYTKKMALGMNSGPTFSGFPNS